MRNGREAWRIDQPLAAADQPCGEAVAVGGKVLNVVVAGAVDEEQLRRRARERPEPFALLQRYELVARAMHQQDRAADVGDHRVGAQRIFQQPLRSERVLALTDGSEAGKRRHQREQVRIDVAGEPRCQRAAERASVDDDGLLAVTRGDHVPCRAHVGEQLLLAADAAGALAVAAEVEDEQIVVDSAVEIDASGPSRQSSGVTVNEEDKSTRLRLNEMQRMERCAGHRDAYFLEALLEFKAIVGGQARAAKDEPLLGEIQEQSTPA